MGMIVPLNGCAMSATFFVGVWTEPRVFSLQRLYCPYGGVKQTMLHPSDPPFRKIRNEFNPHILDVMPS